MSHDTDPPPPDRPTTPELEPIAAGRAADAVRACLVDVLSSVARLEAVAVAVARQLDAGATK